MSFVSIAFLFFLPLVFISYYLLPTKYRWALMLCVSYSFYAYWDWRYVPLLFISSLIDYLCALKMASQGKKTSRRPFLYLSLFVNLGILFSFKYWNFFGSNLQALLNVEVGLHHLLLPLGLSFYTLQTLSYTFDVYLDKIKAERHLGYFCLYVSFFPQLVAGPIERSRSLLPQLKALALPTLYQFRYGLLLIAWGFFVKLVIADNLTASINSVYFSDQRFSFWLYWITGALVTLKIYCDFMAYSEIARGVALLFGVKLTINFRRPLLATNLRSFWQRWHISLTRWIGDYIQIPLLRRFPTEPSRSFVTIVTLVIIGLWHGASWNFILFGLFHGIAMVLWFPVAKGFKVVLGREANSFHIASRLSLAIVLMFSAPMFYIHDSSILYSAISNMLSFGDDNDLLDSMDIEGKLMLVKAFLGTVVLLCVSFYDEFKGHNCIQEVAIASSLKRWGLTLLVLLNILLFGNFVSEPFIYFEF
ncbi:MBOAT family O-acyltransferase [Shewanella colwelliana]|nr:MBOAT family O-acyltransferase [Shewanella colwelliana]